MNAQQFESKGVCNGTRVFIEMDSHVVRAGIFLSTGRSPVDPEKRGVFLAIEPERRVVEWVDLAYLRDISVAIPANA